MKRLLPLLLALVLAITAIVPAYATGDGNFDGGGGSMGDGTKTNYWNPGMDGVRVSIVDVGSHSVVRTPIDLTNKVPIANIAHFGKVSKLSYNAGRGLSVSVSGYSYRTQVRACPRSSLRAAAKPASLPSEAISPMNRLSVPLLDTQEWTSIRSLAETTSW